MTSKSLHIVAQELRSAMDDILPDGVGVTINTCEEEEGQGSISLTVTSWPTDMTMNNRERVAAIRRHLVETGKLLPHEESRKYPHLSVEAVHLVETLQALVDAHCPASVDPETQTKTWKISGIVSIDPNALTRENMEIVQSLKSQGAP